MDEDNHSKSDESLDLLTRKRSYNSTKQNTSDQVSKVLEEPLNKNIKTNNGKNEKTTSSTQSKPNEKKNNSKVNKKQIKKKDTTSTILENINEPKRCWQPPDQSDVPIPKLMESLNCNGVKFTIGDIVSMVDFNYDSVSYGMIRGLLIDSFKEKSCAVTWLIPTDAAPHPNLGFAPDLYVKGKDEDIPRRLELFEFVMHNPGGYYTPKFEHYPKLRSKLQKDYKNPYKVSKLNKISTNTQSNQIKKKDTTSKINNDMNLNKKMIDKQNSNEFIFKVPEIPFKKGIKTNNDKTEKTTTTKSSTQSKQSTSKRLFKVPKLSHKFIKTKFL